jgi:uncharacterized cupredoxin-like copper-binding protein
MTRRAVVVALVVAIATTAAGYALAATTAGAGDDPLGPGEVTVTIDIEHSHFSVDHVRVHTGTLVRFVVRNHDPIPHELIVGDAAVHARHEHGTEATHPPRPGEVSVLPDDDGETFYRFDRPGTFVFACHLPGHYAYGMHGTIAVVGADG